MSDDSKPAYLQGRSRGRGRGFNRTSSSDIPEDRPGQLPKQRNGWCRSGARSEIGLDNASQARETSRLSTNSGITGSVHNPAPVVKFNDAASRHQEAAQRLLSSAKDDAYLSSSDEDNDDDNDTKVINNLLTSFSGSSGDAPQDLGRTHNYLINSFKTKGNVCLVCIESVKKSEPIWNCCGCYTSFHITCIQKWVRDGVYQQTALSDEHFPHRDVPWFCPKCRHEYSQKDCPKKYLCYCGKVADPKFDPWIVPHSCGQECGRSLKPDCGHTCHLLCHPGPCPPCPQTVRISCHCKKVAPQMRRCGASEWSCGKPCLKLLHCGQHQCSSPCHPGPCPVCPKTSLQPCQCRRHSELRQCDDPTWHCDEVCGKQLSCGHHTCLEVCHVGACGQCPRSGDRTCPCGKTKFELPCTEDAPTCLETCGKTLECGRHNCAERCHYGPCGTCRAMVRKKCRCGKRDREIQCYKDFQCDTKCSNLRDCGIHQCKRKCCDGNCPPCTLQCGKTLGCRQHKCASVCHRGPCYPCPLMVDILCACGETKLTVPCGAQKSTRPPRCHQRCRIPPDCHHEQRTAHRCHFGRCPPCRQTCNKPLDGCIHACVAPCHSAVLRPVDAQDSAAPRAGPWEPRKTEVNKELVSLPCPPCSVPVEVTCLGGHETISVPCSEAAVKSCKRVCGRLLLCTNHKCQLECHLVTEAGDNLSAGVECETCEAECKRQCPVGCTHRCINGSCHVGECPPCTRMIRMRCHCSLVVRHVECNKWTSADTVERASLQSCGGECPKPLACGHQCKAVCHTAPCTTDPKKCCEKVKVKCPCGFKRADHLCGDVQSGKVKLECDDRCRVEKERRDKQRLEEEKARIEEEQKRQQAELEEFERRTRGRKRRPRKDRGDGQENVSLLRKSVIPLTVSAVVLMLAVFVYYLVTYQ